MCLYKLAFIIYLLVQNELKKVLILRNCIHRSSIDVENIIMSLDLNIFMN